MPPAIELEGLTKVYRPWLSVGGRKTVVALDGVNLSVPPGEVFGYLGSNGAGKTTTVKILLRLARPSRGTARVMGAQPGGPIRENIGYLPESPYFYDFLTPVELLTFYARIFGLNGSKRKERIQQVLERVGIAHRKDSVLRTFSKGMTQRVGLAQALLNDPAILFLDEPTSGLDPVARHEMRNLILGLKAEGKTVFLNSHQLSEVELICDRVAILQRGKLVRLGAVGDLVKRGGVEIVVRAKGADLPSALVAMAAPGSAGPDADEMRFLLENEAETPHVLRAALDAGADVVSVNPRRETLEELFVRIETEGA
jgi:ABC-2 type transport system ATP-binding protein